MIILGDSIAADPTDWPSQLAHDDGYILHNHAASGQRILDHIQAQADAADGESGDFIIVALGTNDVLPDGVEAAYLAGLQTLQSDHPAAQIYAAGILPKNPNGSRDTINALILSAAASAGVEYWNTDGWIDPATDTYDGIHPNPVGIAKIVVQVRRLLI